MVGWADDFEVYLGRRRIREVFSGVNDETTSQKSLCPPWQLKDLCHRAHGEFEVLSEL